MADKNRPGTTEGEIERLRKIRQFLEEGGRASELPEILKPQNRIEQTAVNNIVNNIRKQKSGTKTNNRLLPDIASLDTSLELSFLMTGLTMAPLPHKQQFSLDFSRSNDIFQLDLRGNPKFGLPFGVIPRLIMIYLCTQAKIQRSRWIDLGNSASEFMSAVGLMPHCGKRGNMKRFARQLFALSSCAMTLMINVKDDSPVKGLQIKNRFFIKDSEFWFDPETLTTGRNRFNGWVLLDEAFYDQIIENSTSLDPYAVTYLSRSVLALDVYTWLEARLSQVEDKTTIPWEFLQLQFGANYKNPYEFRRKFKTALEMVLNVHPDANVLTDTKSLIMYPRRSQFLHKHH